MDLRSQDNITSWFVRHRAGSADDKAAGKGKHKSVGWGGKQRQASSADKAAEAKQQKAQQQQQEAQKAQKVQQQKQEVQKAQQQQEEETQQKAQKVQQQQQQQQQQEAQQKAKKVEQQQEAQQKAKKVEQQQEAQQKAKKVEQQQEAQKLEQSKKTAKQAAKQAGGGSAAGATGEKKPPRGFVAAAAAVADKAKEVVKTAAAAVDAEEQRQKHPTRPAEAAAPPVVTPAAAPAAAAVSAAAKDREREGRVEDAAPREQQQQQQQPPPPAQQVEEAQRRLEEEQDEEAEDRPRVVAYSDSDSDVESHFQRVKHLLPPPKEAEEAAAVAVTAAEATAAAEVAAAAEVVAARQRTRVRRLGRAAAGASSAVAHAAAQHLTPGLAARAGGLLLLSKASPASAAAVGALSMAAPVVGALAARAGVNLGARLPTQLCVAGRELGQLGKAAAAVAAARLAYAGLQHQRRRQQRRRSLRAAAAAAAAVNEGAAEGPQAARPAAPPAPRLLRHRSSVNVAALHTYAELGAAIEARHPQTAAEWAAVYSGEIAELRRMLQENQVELCPERFDATHAELLRFCRASGLLAAKTPAARAVAVETAFSRLVHTTEWVGRQRFLTDRELRRWDRLVAWKAHDTSGRPILLARLGRAQQLVKPERYEEFSLALLTLVHRGLTSHLSNSAGAAEQMVVVLDCRGGGSIGLTRHMGLLKRLAITLNQHYPERLFRLHLLELPLLLRWALHAVMPMLHPNTRSKMVLSSIQDPDLPVTVAFLTKRRSSIKPTLRRTLSNCSFLSSGDNTPALLSPVTTGRSMPLVLTAAPTAAGASLFHRPSLLGGASEPSLAAAPTASAQHAQQGVAEEEDVPHTPPPTLKAPQSPREVTRARRQLPPKPPQPLLQATEQPPAQSWERLQQPQQQHEHSQEGVALPWVASSRAAGAAQSSQQPFISNRRLSLEDAARAAGITPPFEQQQQPAFTAAAHGSGAQQAGGQLLRATSSSTAGPSSHAVPWLSGMQSPSGLLSRDSSYGTEVVPAARAKAAADAVLEVDGEQGVPRLLFDSLTAASSCPQPQASVGPRAADQLPGAASAARGMAGFAALLAAVLPGRRGVDGSDESSVSAMLLQHQGRSRLRRLSSSGSSGSMESGGSSPRTPASARLRGGLTDLPERLTSRGTPNRGLTPRKSSLRRTESAEPTNASCTRRLRVLGSHPLRRQSSVSWAEELETIKEIAAQDGSPAQAWRRGSPLRARLAATGQQHLLLTAIFMLLMTALLAHRLGLTALA